MSLYLRLKRRMGYDTVEKFTRTEPLYEYKVTHLNGEQSLVYAHGYNLDNGFAKFWKYTDEVVTGSAFGQVIFLGGDFWPKKKQTRVLEGIQEIESDLHCHNGFEAWVDMADGQLKKSRMVAKADP